MSALHDAITAFVTTAAPGRDTKTIVEKLHGSGQVELIAGELSIKAYAHSAANLPAGSLPTRLSASVTSEGNLQSLGAYDLVPLLRELVDRGVITAIALHDDATLEEIV